MPGYVTGPGRDLRKFRPMPLMLPSTPPNRGWAGHTIATSRTPSPRPFNRSMQDDNQSNVHTPRLRAGQNETWARDQKSHTQVWPPAVSDGLQPPMTMLPNTLLGDQRPLGFQRQVSTQVAPPPVFRPPPGLSLLEGFEPRRSSPKQTFQKTVQDGKFCDTFMKPSWGTVSNPEDYLVPVSVGSAGHPYSCAEACRYVKRKGGCREGHNCTLCHFCFWRRLDLDESDNGNEGLNVESCGSIGHPVSCGNACKYVRRKGGCRDGKNCLQCHKCVWQRPHLDTPGNDSQPSSPTSGSGRLSKSATPNSKKISTLAQTAPPSTTPGLRNASEEKVIPLNPRQLPATSLAHNDVVHVNTSASEASRDLRSAIASYIAKRL